MENKLMPMALSPTVVFMLADLHDELKVNLPELCEALKDSIVHTSENREDINTQLDYIRDFALKYHDVTFKYIGEEGKPGGYYVLVVQDQENG